ncbi:hypothetical protein AB0M46_05145 [Dactylosporangium sp. NPDC051485]|uniref:hypothetical protein n=1 Tax=Dactylosporangium sp. NPDC051485 TaxID=3154846 RepID=UPI00343B87A4
MNPPDQMGPLERRYRRLLRLLPADHRTTRGEELLGLLIDLDEGRTRPSLRQAAGVFGLALRLRLPRAASLLFAAFLVAYSTAVLDTVYNISTGATTVAFDSRLPVHNVTLALLIPTVLRLGLAVSWIIGARRTAVAVFAALLAHSLLNVGPNLLRFDALVLVVLGVAVALRWPAPRPRVVLLATIPLAMLLWTLTAAAGSHSGYGGLPFLVANFGGMPSITVVVALIGAIGGRLSRRTSTSGSDLSGPRDEPAPATG